jgi:hypothetical protein
MLRPVAASQPGGHPAEVLVTPSLLHIRPERSRGFVPRTVTPSIVEGYRGVRRVTKSERSKVQTAAESPQP